MPKNVKAASFEEFLDAPSRLAEKGHLAIASEETCAEPPTQQILASHTLERSSVHPKKTKVGLTLDPAIVDAIDDYIYHARKQGQRLKKNDVYEAALRQFLGLDESGAR